MWVIYDYISFVDRKIWKTQRTLTIVFGIIINIMLFGLERDYEADYNVITIKFNHKWQIENSLCKACARAMTYAYARVTTGFNNAIPCKVNWERR